MNSFKTINAALIKKWITLVVSLIYSLSSMTVLAQSDASFLDRLTEKFMSYCETNPREEVYVHSDRDEYIAGENVWFEIYLFDRQSNELSSNSRIAYFEILNAENRPVVQKRIRLEEGLGPGHVVLPDTLSSGRYTLRAYTNWMKNSMPHNCFMKSINIYNAFRTTSFMGNEGPVNQLTISDSGGRPPELPYTGISVHTSNLENDSLEIIISADADVRSANRNICYLFIQTHGIINYKNIIKLPTQSTRISIPKNLLISGINHITIFSSSGKPLLEKLVHTAAKKEQYMTLVAPDTTLIRSHVLLGCYPREEMPASLDFANLSISVAPYSRSTFLDMSDYMIFGSEFGILPDALQKQGLSDLAPASLDGFLATAKSNWIDWNTILSANYPDKKYDMERDYHFIYGHLIDRNSLEPDSGRYLFLSQPGKIAVFQYCRTDAEGLFNFGIPIDEEIKELIIQPEAVGRNNIIKIESSFSEEYPEPLSTTDTFVKGVPSYISRYSTNYQVSKIYGSDSTVMPSDLHPTAYKPIRFYGVPDKEIIMSDYIQLPVMQEVFYELLQGVNLKKKKSEYEITIADPVYNIPYDTPPVLFVDGVVVNDPAVIAGLDPEVVEKIDIIRERYLVGEYIFYGLINIITRAGDYSSVTLPGYAVRLSYIVTEPVSEFLSPDFSTNGKKESRIPDYRNTLYWNPSVASNNSKPEVQFWSSDFATEYEINIQGVTSDGKTISLKKIFTVKKRE
jgi:hypothetical protein